MADGIEPILLEYQQKWVKDSSILKLMEKARRVGVTYATGYERVRAHSQKGRTLDSWISSRDEPTAQIFIRECGKFLRVLKAGADDLGLQIIGEKGEKAHVLEFANATRVNSVASNADVFAGKGGDVLLDEFALRKDPEAVHGIAGPTIDWGGALAIVSTHRGSANYFNRLIGKIRDGSQRGWSLHTVTLENALEQGLLYKLQRHYREGDPRLDYDEGDYFNWQRERSASEEIFKQEYCCVPGDDAAAFLDYGLISGCMYAPAQIGEWRIVRVEKGTVTGTRGGLAIVQPRDVAELRLSGDAHVGIDIGRDHDFTVIELSETIGGVEFVRLVVELQNTTFAQQEEWLYAILSHPAVRRACGDQTGIGRQMIERAQQRFGKYKVEGVTFTPATKEEMAYPVRASFEDRSVRVPDDKFYEADLRNVKKETLAGNVRFSADRGKNGHSDRFWSRALCRLAGKRRASDMSASTSNTTNSGGLRSDFGGRGERLISGGRAGGL